MARLEVSATRRVGARTVPLLPVRYAEIIDSLPKTSASFTYLDADIRVTAWSGGIAVIVELSLIYAQHGSDGTLATVLCDVAVNACCDAVGVSVSPDSLAM